MIGIRWALLIGLIERGENRGSDQRGGAFPLWHDPLRQAHSASPTERRPVWTIKVWVIRINPQRKLTSFLASMDKKMIGLRNNYFIVVDLPCLEITPLQVNSRRSNPCYNCYYLFSITIHPFFQNSVPAKCKVHSYRVDKEYDRNGRIGVFLYHTRKIIYSKVSNSSNGTYNKKCNRS